MENLYKHTAKLYDEDVARIGNEDIEFYFKEIGTNKTVLELGCGTGRVSLALAKNGNKLVGVDLSLKMLEVFKEKIVENKLSDNITIKHADMSSFELTEQFDWIIFPFRAFQALTTNEQRENCLEGVKKHLKPNGKMVIQMFNPNEEILKYWSAINRLEYSYESKVLDAEVARYLIGESHDTDLQTISYRNEFKIKGQKQPMIQKMKLGYLYHHQAIGLFKKKDFKVKAIYSDWQKNAVTEDVKKELIYVLKRT